SPPRPPRCAPWAAAAGRAGARSPAPRPRPPRRTSHAGGRAAPRASPVGVASLLASGERFEDAQEAGMVPFGAAQRLRGVEELLRRRRVGKRDPERAGAGKREREVLLVQLDAEAGVAAPVPHALTMHLEDAR